MKRIYEWEGDSEEIVNRFADAIEKIAEQEPFNELEYCSFVEE